MSSNRELIEKIQGLKKRLGVLYRKIEKYQHDKMLSTLGFIHYHYLDRKIEKLEKKLHVLDQEFRKGGIAVFLGALLPPRAAITLRRIFSDLPQQPIEFNGDFFRFEYVEMTGADLEGLFVVTNMHYEQQDVIHYMFYRIIQDQL